MRRTVFILLAAVILTLPAVRASALDTKSADPLLNTLSQAGQGFDGLVRTCAGELGSMAAGGRESESLKTLILLGDLGGMALSQARLAMLLTWHADSSEGPAAEVSSVRDSARQSLLRVAEVMRLLRDAADLGQAWSEQSEVQAHVQALRVLSLAGDEVVAGLQPLLGSGQIPTTLDTPFAKRVGAELKKLDAPSKKAREQLHQAAKAEEFGRDLEVECQLLYATWLLGAATELHAYASRLPATAAQPTHLDQARSLLSRQSVTLQAHFMTFGGYANQSVGGQAGTDIETVHKDLLAVCGTAQGLLTELPSQVGLASKPAPPAQTAKAAQSGQGNQIAQAGKPSQSGQGNQPGGLASQTGQAPQGMALLQSLLPQGGMAQGAQSPILQGLEMMGGMLN